MYIPLRVFSAFSIGFGANQLADLTEYALAHDIPAIGIADLNTMAGLLTLSKGLGAKGIQTLSGVTLDVRHRDVTGTLVLYATDAESYHFILRQVNRRNLATTPAPLMLDALLADAPDGVIALSGGHDGLLEKTIAAGKDAAATAADLKSAFGDRFYIELQRDSSEPGPNEATLLSLAKSTGAALVATSEAHYAKADMVDAYDAYLCITDKTVITQSDRRHALRNRHLVSPEEMETRFSDLPEAIANSEEIARRASFLLKPEAPRLPLFETGSTETEAEMLKRLALEGLEERLALTTVFDGGPSRKIYEDRLAYELGVITKMGFSGYFLIVADFIGWARDNGIPVGPGRGSGAGSLVAYALRITDIDPLKLGLMFERFLNPDRVSMPDFDVDFSQEGRERVIDYVRGKYGADRVAHIAAFGTLQARAVVRDTGRVLQIPFRVVDGFAKMIPQNPSNPVTLAEAMEEETLAAAIARADETVKTMFEIALKIEKLFRNVSTHAAGMIISDRPIADVVPVHLDQYGKLTTSYEMKAVEAAGLVKFDFLGLKNLDIIKGATDFASRLAGREIDLSSLGFEDPETYANLASGDGFAVFQLESAGMCQALKGIRVETLEELIALISLYRPGPMDHIPDYAAVKQGERDIEYLHPEMEKILKQTNGVMIYQEQVMETAQVLAGFSLGEADLLRRAMGKKIQSEMDAQEQRFIAGAGAGWVEVTLENGETRKLHAMTKLPVLDGTNRMVTISEAVAEGLEVAL